ncbi:uncharacterized protein LOC125945091 [Dermacentor silvarum]|uniref:uncharacterized protein LOC125945091 n=1 Tax=Dermacentor silvarum TaxID=543639 RepID=UPI002100D8F6|nr:uncharacterized protein LOC125945091 [Dermacentor silvarum]
MEPQKKRRKRGWYKKYLNPSSVFHVPRSTDSSARLRLAQAESSKDDGSYHRSSNEELVEPRPAVEDEYTTQSAGTAGEAEAALTGESDDPTAPDSDSDGTGIICSRALASPQPGPSGCARNLHERGGGCNKDNVATEEDTDNTNQSGEEYSYATDLDSDDDTTGLIPITDTQHGELSSMAPESSHSEPEHMSDGQDLFSSADTNRTTQLGELFQGALNEKVVVSKGDMLLMILQHALKNNLTLTALTNLIEMINLFFERPVLPQSKYISLDLEADHLRKSRRLQRLPPEYGLQDLPRMSTTTATQTQETYGTGQPPASLVLHTPQRPRPFHANRPGYPRVASTTTVVGGGLRYA